MDSLSQIALGSAISVATMGRRTAVWKAALWGAVAGTLPDLDVLIDHGDAVRNMVLHRAESHSLFWLTLFSLPFAALVARIQGQWHLLWRWWAAMWLALITHPLLDAMTVYGTQLFLPLTNYPYGVGSVFIIDLFYTLPLLIGVGWALKTRGGGYGLRANTVGLVLSTVYLAWGVFAQQQASRVANASLAAQSIAAERVLVTPTAFNSLLWRVVAVSGDDYFEGFYSLLDPTPADGQPTMTFDRFSRGRMLANELKDNDSVRRIADFSHGFYGLREAGGQVLISDLRMGQEPNYSFTFVVAERHNPIELLTVPVQLAMRPDIKCGLPWIWQRMWGVSVPPVRECPDVVE